MKTSLFLIATLFSYLIVSFPLSAQQFSTEDFQAFGQSIDTMSLQNIKTSIHKQRKALEFVQKFTHSFKAKDEIKDYKPADEKTMEPYALDTLAGIHTFDKLLHTRLGFTQDLQEDHTDLKFNIIGSSVMDAEPKFRGPGYVLILVPTAIYYSNGTIQTDSLPDCTIDFHFRADWGKPLPIDSIAFKVTLKYVEKMDTLEVNRNKKEINYRGGSVKILKTDRNFIYYTISDTIDHFGSEVFNQAGEPLEVETSKAEAINPDKKKKQFQQLLSGIIQLDDQIQDETKSVEAARKCVKEALATIDLSEYKQTELTHYYKWCGGNVAGVRVYVIKNQVILQGHITSINTDERRIACIYSKDQLSMSLMDKKGNILLTTKALSQINSNYYEGDKYYYYFNEKTLAFDTLSYFSLDRLNDDLVCAQEDNKDPAIIYNKYHQALPAPNQSGYDYVDVNDGILIGKKGKAIYIINQEGAYTLMKGITDCHPFVNGYAVVKNEKNLHGYIDKQGKQIIPCIYSRAADASQNTFCVENNGKDFWHRKYGYLDIHGKTIIPFIYDDANPFFEGFALVKIQDKGYGLINMKNEVVVPLTHSSSYTEGIFGKRTYVFDGDVYDSHGNFIKKQD